MLNPTGYLAGCIVRGKGEIQVENLACKLILINIDRKLLFACVIIGNNYLCVNKNDRTIIMAWGRCLIK